MHRFFVPAEMLDPQRPALTGDEARHCLRVRRIMVGERLVIFDGQGREVVAVLEREEKRQAICRTLEVRQIPRPHYQLALAPALLPHRSMDFVFQKATELGVTEIHPLITDRIVAQMKHEDAPTKLQRWREICIEAAKQCGAAWLPSIHSPTSIVQLAKNFPEWDLKLIASLRQEARALQSVLQQFESDQKRRAKKTLVAIGPEGDFMDKEINAATAAGFIPITLGPLTLRSETAALYAASVLSYELRGSDNP